MNNFLLCCFSCLTSGRLCRLPASSPGFRRCRRRRCSVRRAGLTRPAHAAAATATTTRPLILGQGTDQGERGEGEEGERGEGPEGEGGEGAEGAGAITGPGDPAQSGERR
jgi:hypothetical protein